MFKTCWIFNWLKLGFSIGFKIKIFQFGKWKLGIKIEDWDWRSGLGIRSGIRAIFRHRPSMPWPRASQKRGPPTFLSLYIKKKVMVKMSIFVSSGNFVKIPSIKLRLMLVAPFWMWTFVRGCDYSHFKNLLNINILSALLKDFNGGQFWGGANFGQKRAQSLILIALGLQILSWVLGVSGL